MKSEMTRKWLVDQYLPAHPWRCAADVILAELDSIEDSERPFVEEKFRALTAVSGTSISKFWADSTKEPAPKFVDVLLDTGDPDLCSALLMEIKYNVNPESDEPIKQWKSLNKHAIAKAIQQIESSRKILTGNQMSLEGNYPAYIMIPEKRFAVIYHYLKERARGRQTPVPAYTKITSFNRIDLRGDAS